jgi:hypothetical protein
MLQHTCPHPAWPRIGVTLLVGVGAALACAGPHPRLLISPADVPRLRRACGIETAPDGKPGGAGFGSHSADYQALRAGCAHLHDGEPLPGELPAASFLHVISPRDADDAARLRWIRTVLQRPMTAMIDPCEAILALDWCWDSLDPAIRRELLFSLSSRAEPLTASDSPLHARRFSDKLTTLALTLVADETDEPSPSWLARRERLLSAARTYFTTTFPTFVAWRSLSPTGPASAAGEERNTALAVELAGPVLQRDVWPAYQASVGRWLEHYLFADLDHPAVPHNFIRDDGNQAPLTPAPAWRDLLPLTAHLIAARTRDPAAAAVADRVEREWGAGDPPWPVEVLASQSSPQTAAPTSDDLRALWRWVPLVFDISDVPRYAPQRLPAARNLGGAVIFRGGSGTDTTAVWIDAAQPFLRRRQHFDAGHFLIYRGGHLAVDGGDDIVLDAIASKGGAQHLGGAPDPFDFEQYLTATIAHNCLVFWDPARITRWYDEPYLPAGGQRCIEDTCTDFVRPLEAQGRQTGRQLAYGLQGGAAYLALDLAPAYEARLLTAYTREFIFLFGRALIVVDRVASPKGRPVPTWILNLPARPLVDGADLNEKARVAGSANDAGLWRYDGATWLRWTDGAGALWLSVPLPDPRCMRIVGGPGRPQRVSDGRGGACTYVGGEADGFERLIIPGERRGARNAWYRLGAPGLTGPAASLTAHWGRVEIEPPARGTATAFLSVLITDRAESRETPALDLTSADGVLTLEVQAGEDSAALRLPADGLGGTVEVRGAKALTWTLPTKVEPDAALPRAARDGGR